MEASGTSSLALGRDDPLDYLRFDRNDRLTSCLIADAAGRTDLHSQERLRHALRLAHACRDVYASSTDGDGPSRRATDRIGLTRIDDEGLVALGLNPGDFELPSFGYHAELYVDRSPQSETQCMPTFDDFRREFEGRDSELRYVLANRGHRDHLGGGLVDERPTGSRNG